MAHKRQWEAESQAALFRWAFYEAATIPELNLLFHIPNGGSRNKIEAVNLKRQGVKSGVPDLFLPVARGKWHGLFIEMKHGVNKPSKNQEAWIENLHKQGYAVVVCYDWEKAAELLKLYIQEDTDDGTYHGEYEPCPKCGRMGEK
jgi:hypothetical protein